MCECAQTKPLGTYIQLATTQVSRSIAPICECMCVIQLKRETDSNYTAFTGGVYEVTLTSFLTSILEPAD